MYENYEYSRILMELPVGLKRDVMWFLAGHVGGENRLGRGELVTMLRRMPVYSKKRLVRLDRLVRLAIAELQEDGYPILSDSGKGGYWLAGSREEVEGMCAEMESRAQKLLEKVRALRQADKLAWVEPEAVEQLRMGI